VGAAVGNGPAFAEENGGAAEEDVDSGTSKRVSAPASDQSDSASPAGGKAGPAADAEDAAGADDAEDAVGAVGTVGAGFSPPARWVSSKNAWASRFIPSVTNSGYFNW
jgi:hypothetical protein